MNEKTVLLDVMTAGASGDMFLSALIDLLDDDNALVPVAASLLIYDPTIRVHVDKVEDGRTIKITHDQGLRLSPESLREIITGVSEELELSKQSTTFALKALQEIMEAESRAHDMPVEKLHLHETGSVDTVLDIVGTAYLLEKAGLMSKTRFLSTPVAVGSGTIQIEHGEMEVPVPAVAELLVSHEVPFITGDAKTEVLTPTGAAILVSLVNEFVDSTDGFDVIRSGVGYGSRDLGEVPNRMRILVGTPQTIPPVFTAETPTESTPIKTQTPHTQAAQPHSHPPSEAIVMQQGWDTDNVIVIEANVDDVDGEAIGTIFDALLKEGNAYDVVMIPAYGKKNRPCYVVKVITTEENLTKVAEIMVRHLGTLGVRYTNWSRLKASREVIVCRLEVDDKEYMVRVKISRGPNGEIINIKPEADDLVKVSAETGIPVREIKPRIALQAYAVTE
ncbi:MAG: nickel pincer cofactor biosynthesis protein LarC [Candidatus Thorarchaeota archaeon]|nr:nickel pincer cofactor biosynthesis protein LarC [Candidatus Thorarchaeota archaeon]